MAKKEETVEQEPLTEEQRIAALEDRAGTNKIILISIALFLVVAVSVSATFLAVSLFTGEKETGDSETVIALQAKVIELEKTIEELEKVSKRNRSDILIIGDKVANSSNMTLQQVIIDQEKGNQAFLEALKTGMYDLAHMLPGSRTWLEVYGEKVEHAEIQSKERERTLLNMKQGSTGKSPQDDPFSDGF